MRIAVIGTGNIGGTLGRRWLAVGHEVVYGGRQAGGQGPGGAPVLAAGDALAGADVVVLAVPGPAVADVLAPHGAALDGRVVIDATNNIGAAEVNGHAAVAATAPGAHYARAFNTLGWENFAEPPPGAVLFYAADVGARPAAEELITAVGLDPVLLGDSSAVGVVDALLPLWFALVRQHGGNRRIALRVTQ